MINFPAKYKRPPALISTPLLMLIYSILANPALMKIIININ
ncbi:hypothetical protein yaldo0001_18650 [Yersinia aldovae ATCC 35236]|nr:hypothetical protein yaldo0001_18650 [Yersinia aldovae ATCC 35236]